MKGLLRRGIHPGDLEVLIEFDDGVHGAVEQPAQFFLPLPNLFLGAQSAHFGGGAKMLKSARTRGSSGIGRRSITARCPKILPSVSFNGIPR